MGSDSSASAGGAFLRSAVPQLGYGLIPEQIGRIDWAVAVPGDVDSDRRGVAPPAPEHGPVLLSDPDEGTPVLLVVAQALKLDREQRAARVAAQAHRPTSRVAGGKAYLVWPYLGHQWTVGFLALAACCFSHFRALASEV